MSIVYNEDLIIKMDKKEIENKIIQLIKTIYDPEIPVDVFELGLIYGIDIDDELNVKIDMTLTSPSCPEAESLPGKVESVVKTCEGLKSASVNITFDPPWDKDMMSEEAKLELGLM